MASLPNARVSRSTFSPQVTLYTPTSDQPEEAKPDTTNWVRRSSRSTAAVKPEADVKPAPRPTRSRHFQAEVKEEDDVAEELKPEVKPKPAKTPKPKVFKRYLEVAHPAPKRWREAFEIIKEQRKGLIAPVDTMGCDQAGDDLIDVKPLTEKDKRLSTMVSLMMSSQTKDPVTHQATQNLKRNLRHGLSLQGLLEATEEEIDEQICKVGFHATKAMNLKKLAVRLRDLHDGDVPSDLDSLLAINGVGPKMAFLYLQSIGMNEGIGVDVHVHRITHRLRWHNKEPKNPEETRLNLESWLPKEHHREINHILVGFGQTICKPVGPRCDLCHVAQVPGLCPSRRRDLGPFPTAKSVKEELEEGKPKVEIEVERVEEVGEGQVKLELGMEERVPVADGEAGVKREAESPARRSARGTPRKRVKVEKEL